MIQFRVGLMKVVKEGLINGFGCADIAG
jgi:hypothetical protein